MLNKVQLIGHLGRDPEVRSTQTGDRIANLSVATSESWKKDGERQTRTEWARVVVFAPQLVDIAEKYLRKGSLVYIEGKMQTRKWVDQGGTDRYTTEVVLQRYGSTLRMLDKRENGGQPERRDEAPAARSHSDMDLDDEVPF